MRMLCFVPDANTPGTKDVDGAFLPEARAFARHHGADPGQVIKRFPATASLPARRTACTQALRSLAEPVDVLAFFCHGWRSGLQAGYQLAQIPTLALLLAQRMTVGAYVLLYACETGRDQDSDHVDDQRPGPGGDGGFADELRDALEELDRQVTVMGHTTAGHCTWNPHARLFTLGVGCAGGCWAVEPKSALWPAWVRAMRDPRSTLRYRFWSMTAEEIAAELAPKGGPLVA